LVKKTEEDSELHRCGRVWQWRWS